MPKRSTFIQPQELDSTTYAIDARKAKEPEYDEKGRMIPIPEPETIIRDGRLVFLYIDVENQTVLNCRNVLKIDWTKINNGDFHAYDEELDIDVWASSKSDLNKAVQKAIWKQWKIYAIKEEDSKWSKDEEIIHSAMLRHFDYVKVL